MHKLDLISQPRVDKGRKHHRFAYLVSALLHGLALVAVIMLACLYRQLPLPKSGSTAGSTSISLEKMLVVAPPTEPLPTPPQAVMPKVSPAPVDPGFGPMRAEVGIPVLVTKPEKAMKPVETTQAKPRMAAHGTAQTELKTAPSTAVSSYAPGQNFMPHPPYPDEAHERGETGTVVLNVYFSPKGDVAQIEVTQSSGSSILDSETRSFIRTRWHCPEFAGQIKNVPVQYTLQAL